MNILCIAETSNIAKSLLVLSGESQVLTVMDRMIKTYHFPYHYQGNDGGMVVTGIRGHLMEKNLEGTMRSWSVLPELIFDASVVSEVASYQLKMVEKLKRLIEECSLLVLWMDCDKEGENIGFELIELCKSVNEDCVVKRAWFSDLSRRSVVEAMNNLIEPDVYKSMAIDARQEIDLKVGTVFTRFQTLRWRNLPSLDNTIISFGSASIPILGIVVERERIRKNFTLSSFSGINLETIKDDVSVQFKWTKNNVDHADGVRLLDSLQESNCYVSTIESKSTKKFKPFPLNETTLLKNISKFMGLSSRNIMIAAESLYQKGFISYPRTNTIMYPDCIDLENLIILQNSSEEWGEYTHQLLENKFCAPGKLIVGDHVLPPIHPVNYTDNLEGDEKIVYEYVVRHFLASCSRDAEGVLTTITAKIEDELFTAQGILISDRGFLEIFPYKTWTEKLMPIFEENENLKFSLEITYKQNMPPPLSESKLISLLDQHGIGSDCTKTQHIQTLQQRGYISLEDNIVLPTLLGEALISSYNTIGLDILTSPTLRAEIESDLTSISESVKEKHEVITSALNKYKSIFSELQTKTSILDQHMSSILTNPQQTNPG